MNALPRWFLGVLFSASMSAAAAPLAPTALPAAPSLLEGTDPLAAFTLRTAAAAAGAAKFETVPADGPGFTRAWRIATLQDTSPMDAIELRAPNARPVKKGDVAMIRFFGRAILAADETGTGRVYVVVRRNGVDSNSSFEGDYTLGREWQEVLIPFVFARDFPAGDAAVMLRFGFKRQTLEIGGLEVLDYGRTCAYEELPRTRFSYAGREAGAAWRREALERIGRIRQADIFITVRDGTGRPVPGAEVRIVERRSAFQWGTALQMARLVKDSPDNRRYRETALELFNSASTENDLKWPVWLGEWEGGHSQAQTLAGLHWLHDHGFAARGHVLVWPGRKNLPKPIQERLGTPRQGEIPALVDAHIREMARATRGLVSEWDVLNEPFTNHDLMDAFGPEIMVSWFKTARAELPNAALFFNDFSNQDATTDADHVAHFEKTARFLLDHGAPVTGLGLQGHFGGKPNDPEHVLAVLDRYQAEFHLPVRITEFDVWTYDEELQADYTRDFLILCYSHPSVVGVQFWGFWAGAHWRPQAAMFREDWSERPAARVYRDLVLDQWRTRAAGRTDAKGGLSLRGFQGDYTLSVSHQSRRIEREFTLSAQAAPAQINVTLP
jgi:GH35 family endo-1,4-beta-xylanase